jgi:hypothetical protein
MPLNRPHRVRRQLALSRTLEVLVQPVLDAVALAPDGRELIDGRLRVGSPRNRDADSFELRSRPFRATPAERRVRR